MVATQLYHTRDPIENLRVLVTLRKIARGVGESEGGNRDGGEASQASPWQTALVPLGTTWTRCFRWQERWPPPNSQRADQVKHDLGTQDSSYDALMSFAGSGPLVPPPAKWTSGAASLVVARDTMSPEHSKEESDGHGGDSSVWISRNRERAWRRMLREEGAAVREMHIGARIEWNEEVLLLTLRHHASSGLLRSTPGFSAPTGDAESDPDRALKGPALSTYQFESSSGARYEVAFENASDLQPLESTEHERAARELALRERRDAAAAVEKWQQKQTPVPSRALSSQRAEYGKRVGVMCEVVSVKNSRSRDPIGVEYALAVETGRRRGRTRWHVVEDSGRSPATPRSDKSRSHSSRPRHTPLCAPRPSLGLEIGRSTAAFASHATFHAQQRTRKRGAAGSSDGDKGELECWERLLLRFSVYSRDGWGRKRREAFGQLHVPPSPGFYDSEVPLWKPVLSVREQLEEQFLGMNESEASWYSAPRSDASMWGATCESTDMTVRVRLNIAVSGVAVPSGSHLNRPTSNVFEGDAGFDGQGESGSRVVKRSVQEILQAVRLEKRLGAALSSVVDRALVTDEQAGLERKSLV